MANLRLVAKILLVICTGAFLMLPFTNCSKYKQPELNSGSSTVASSSLEDDPLLNFVSSGDLCEDDLKKLYLGGYYRMVRTNCASCHMQDADKPQFASMDYSWAYSVFKSKGYEKISSNAISENHKPPATGLHLTGEVNDLRTEWKKGLELYNVCKGLPKDGVITEA